MAILISITVFMVLFCACGRIAASQYVSNENTSQNNISQDNTPAHVDNSNEASHLTHEDFLSDLAFLVALLEENFPQLNHAYRKFGLDINLQEAKTAQFIETLPSSTDFDANLLVNILNQHIFAQNQNALSLAGNGVATFWGAIEYYWIMHASVRMLENSELLMLQREALSNPATIASHEAMIDRMTQLGFDMADERPRFDRPLLPIINRNVTPAIQLDGIEMRSSDENIAYIRLHMDLAHAFWEDEEVFISYWADRIFDFYSQIESYGHLIIDVRGERAASLNLFGQLLLGPFIENRQSTLDMYGFFQGGGASETFARAMISNIDTDRASETTIYRINDLPAIVRGDLPHMNLDDLAILDYGFTWQTKIPGGNRQSHFNGTIWILIDEDTASAAEIFAKVARNEGVATLVGSQTLGNFGKISHNGNAALATLPNTGVIIAWDPIYFTDDYGHPIHEYHVIPDYFNHEGMDALEIVLEIIRDRANGS